MTSDFESAAMLCAKPCANGQSKQKGAILVVSLIMLMVITILALAGMQGVALQGRMSSNSYDRNIAFQASEMALRWAELKLLNHEDADVGEPFEPFDATTAPSERDFANQDWTDTTTWKKAAPDAVKPADAIANPRVTVLEYDDSCFQVFSIGVGRSATSQAVLNSVVCRE